LKKKNKPHEIRFGEPKSTLPETGAGGGHGGAEGPQGPTGAFFCKTVFPQPGAKGKVGPSKRKRQPMKQTDRLEIVPGEEGDFLETCLLRPARGLKKD